MNEAGHRDALEQIRRARSKLDPAADIRSYAELTHGMALHAVAAGAVRRHGADLDNHQGMVRWLRDHGYPDIADTFNEIESLRVGRWYGRQGNGSAAHRLDELIGEIESWSLA
jgi:hypothetical protein